MTRKVGRPKKYDNPNQAQAEWKKKTNFEKCDRRKGYRVGFQRAKRGLPKADVGDRSPEYQTGYDEGYVAGLKSQI